MMLQHFWALPAILRFALASQHVFSVQDDLLAYPQYEILWPNTYISQHEAQHALSQKQNPSQVLHQQDLQAGSDISPHINPDTYDAHGPPITEEDRLQETYELMTLADRKYLCSIPIIRPSNPTNTSQSPSSSASEEKENELVRASDRGWELLKGMQGTCLYYLSGYWSYSFCYDSGVKQFHQLPPSKGFPTFPPVEDPSVESFMLGRFDMQREGLGAGERKEKGDGRAGEVATVQMTGETRYLAQKMGGGTMCPLIGRDRRVEVQFHCHPQGLDRIGLIKETSTCSYLMVIHTPRLCNDVAFLPPRQERPNPITCKQVLTDDEIPAWEANQRSEAELLLQPPIASSEEEDEAEEEQSLPVVGGTVVGLKKDVGAPGKIIEPGVVVGGGKETYIGTVATSEGKIMAEKELKKLGIVELKDVEELMERLRKMAGVKTWKLEVVDTPRGRQLRAVVDSDQADGEDAEGRQEGDGQDGSEESYNIGV